MTANKLYEQIKAKRSCLCVGLDTVLEKLPAALDGEQYPLFIFYREIIDATADCAVCYKPNTAFYECYGAWGWQQLEMTVGYIKEHYPEIMVIADAKRGDIGNAAARYAKAFFDNMPCDAVTLAPYMGRDSIAPFLEYKGKWAVVLGLTSNASAADFELDGDLYKKVIGTAMEWGTPDNMMFVAGAGRRSPGRQRGRSGKVRPQFQMRPADKLFQRHHICLFGQRFCRSRGFCGGQPEAADGKHF